MADFYFHGKRMAVLVLTACLALGCCVSEAVQGDGKKNFSEGDVVVGIAWRADTDSEFYTNICKVLEQEGVHPVLLQQVKSDAVSYLGETVSDECICDVGYLTQEYADIIKQNTYQNSNIETVMKGIDAVIFTGGEDIGPTLLRTPTDWCGIEAEIDFNAARDISDYLLMSYCLDKDIPVMGFCRGMQMLSVVSGASMISDIPLYFENHHTDYDNMHRNLKITPDSYRDYAPHPIVLVGEDTLLSEIYGTSEVEKVPSWHHQAVKSVEDTSLIVTAKTETNGIDIIEAVERTDKSFAVGLQFHPEAAAVKHLEKAENAAQFMDYSAAMQCFDYFIHFVRENALSKAA